MFCIWTKGSGFSSSMAISRLDSLTVSLELLECTTGIGSTFLLFAGCKQYTAIDCVYKNHIITWIQELPKQKGHTHFQITIIKVPYYILTAFHKKICLKIHYSCNKHTLINLTSFLCDGLIIMTNYFTVTIRNCYIHNVSTCVLLVLNYFSD